MRDRFYLTRRADQEGVEVREILRASMGALDLVTPPSGVMSRRRTLGSLLGAGGLALAIALSFATGNVTVLFVLYPVVFLVTAITSYIVQRWNLRSVISRPGVIVRRVRVLEAKVGTLFHSLRVQADGEELNLGLLGLRGGVTEGLRLSGYSIGPFR